MQAHIGLGTLIADRFEIGAIAGSGGMGTVYRALDRYTGQRVALKVLRRSAGGAVDVRRFVREAQILSQLQHPGIVSYVDSGCTPEGLDYLVMEWLEGEELGHRISRGALSVTEGQKLLQRVAEALACAHQLGIVHRDIKPSNLFLCGGRFERVVVLDFGVAHCQDQSQQSALTRAGSVIGTLEYMAPEQARADATIGAPADIYSLGRVAYQCLSGQARDSRQQVAAMLARTLFELEKPLHQCCPWVPEPLSALIARMLAKDPAARPADGGVLLHEVQGMGVLSDAPGMTGDVSPCAVSLEEQILYSIVLAVPANASQEITSELSGESVQTSMEARKALESTLNRQGAHATWLLDGSLLLTMTPSVSAHDQAAQAARCALFIKDQWPTAEVAVATGRGIQSGETLIGEVVDRAAGLMHARRALSEDNSQAAVVAPGSIWVDSLSAALLERRFAIVPVTGGAVLTREMISSEELRPVMGIAPPCIGREQEFSILDAILSRCSLDSEAQAVVITAAPGLGKTRLRQEFVARARQRSQPTTVLLGVGDVLSMGAPYSLLGQGLRHMCGITPGLDPVVARQALSSFCIQLLGEAGGQTAPFIGEMCGLPFPDSEAQELRSARCEPKIMSDRIGEAFVDLLRACCEREPVLWVLDDLQWGDFLTVQMLDRALHDLEMHPLMVLALGRPELATTFPKTRKWPRVKDFPLDGLSRSASERFVRCVLGSATAASVVTRIAQQAAGNVLLLEELIRAEREHHGQALPETVLAIMQARLQRLEPRLRLLLGRASLFGNRFWRGGLMALLDGAALDDVESDLRALEEAELITVHKESRLKGEVEYSFRHPLNREAAYSLLLEDQKRRWHRIAGQYLEQAGEPEPLVLAQHFSQSDEPSRAVPYFIRVATLSLEGNDLAGARTCVAQGLDCQAEGALRGELLGIATTVLMRTAQIGACLRTGEEALTTLPLGNLRWCQTMEAMLIASALLGRGEVLGKLATRFLTIEPQPEVLAAYLQTGGMLLTVFGLSGQRAFCSTLLARMEARVTQTLENEPSVMAWLRYGQHRFARWLTADPWTSFTYAQEAASAAMRSGNRLWIGIMQGAAAIAELELGSQQAEEKLKTTQSLLHSMAEESMQDSVAMNAALVRWTKPEHALELAELARAVMVRHKGTSLFTGMAHWLLAQSCLAQELWAESESEAREALSILRAMPPMRLGVFAVLMRSLLAQGCLTEANEVAREALTQLDALDGVGWMDLNLRLGLIDVRHASGDVEGVRSELRTAASLLKARAERIPDPTWRQRYLENTPENVRILTLSRELLEADDLRP